MKISFFIGNMVSGGAERVISLLANDYARTGWDVDIVLLLKNEVNRKQFALDKSINIVDLSMKGNSYKTNAMCWLLSIRKYCKNRNPDCIISFIGRINALVLTATLGLNIPILVSERNDPRHDGRSKFMQWYCNKIYQRAAAIVYQTEYEKGCFDRRLDKKSFVIPNPVEVTVEGNITENEFELSTAGRLVDQKNQTLLIDAVSIVEKKYPQVECYIFGEGELRGKLEDKVAQLGLERNVHLPGNKTDVYKWVAKSSIFVMTSNFEGLSNALIEAMMLGKACISTDYPGASELIVDGRNGLIVPCNNPQELAKAIVRLFEQEEFRQEIKRNARIDSEKFKKPYVIEQWRHAVDVILQQ